MSRSNERRAVTAAGYYRVVLLRLLFFASAALASAACNRGPDTRPDLVVIVMDTARPDYLSVYGHPRPTSPFLVEFAQQGTVYERAYSTSCWTLPAHASLFTGAAPQVHGANQTTPVLGPQLPVLAEQLQEAGYRTAGFSANAWVSKSSGLARGFESFANQWRRAEGAEAPAGEHHTVSGVKEWLAQADQRPSFLFVNLIEPHAPYRPSWEHAAPFFALQTAWDAATQALFPKGRSPNWLTVRHYWGSNPLQELEWQWMRALYEGELRETDAIVRDLVAAVDAAPSGRPRLVYVLSDHGENLGDHGHISHVFNLYDSNVRIVLLGRGPGIAAGKRDTQLVGIRDLYPTLLAAAGLPAPASNGETYDLRGPLPEQRLLGAALDVPKLTIESFPDEMERAPQLEMHKRELEAVISARWKMIRGSDGSCLAFDLLADPHESHPVPCAELEPSVRTGLDAWLDLQRQRRVGDATPTSAPQDPATRAALQSLGYVE